MIDHLDHCIGYRLAALYAARFHQPVVLTHQQLRFDLLQGIQYYGNHDQEGCSPIKRGKTLSYTCPLGKPGKDADHSQQDSSRQRDLIHHGSDEIRCGLSWFHTGNKTVIAFEIISNLLGVKDERRVKKSETDHHDGIESHVYKIARIRKYPGDAFFVFKAGIRN